MTWPALMNEHTKMRRDEMIHEMDGRNILSRVVALPWSWREKRKDLLIQQLGVFGSVIDA